MEQNVEIYEKKIREIKRKNELSNKTREKLEKYFDFYITSYIIDDIVENEDYYHFCLMVNLAVVNNRLTADNGEKLKLGIKRIFNIKNNYELLKASTLF